MGLLFGKRKYAKEPAVKYVYKGVEKLGIYVHIPFCIQKCDYCDFYSLEGESDLSKDAYVESVCMEIKDRARLIGKKFVVDTIFIGGGTPTCIRQAGLIQILNTIKSKFKLTDDVEITVESNPAASDQEKFVALKEAGVNRLSIGVQSFNDDILKNLGRVHDAEEAEEAVDLAQGLGFNVNIDLMFGVPGQTLEIWKETLEHAVSLDPEHISFYSLQLEEGTPMYEDYKDGRIDLPSWEENRQMYHYAVERLKSAGYHHYEVSNAAKPGFECRHNIKYWTMEPYLGLGAAAHSFITSKRLENVADIHAYKRVPAAAFKAVSNDKEDLMGDYIFTRLRIIEGFPKAEFNELFEEDFDEYYGEDYRQLLADGYLKEEGDVVSFTEKGLDNTNYVMEQLLNIEAEDDSEEADDE